MDGEGAAPVEAPIETGTAEASDPVVTETGTTSAEAAPEAPGFATLEDLEEFVSGRGGKVRIKANGEEREVPWEEAKRYLPLGRGAHQQFEAAQAALNEAREIETKAEMLAEMVTQKPAELLRRLSPEVREQYIRAVGDLLAEESAPPERREAMQRERELEELRRYRQEREQNEQRQQMTQLEAQAYETIQRQFAGAMDKAQLPSDAGYRTEIMKRMAGLQRETLRRGAAPLHPDELLEIARSEVREPARNVLRASSVDELKELLGPDLIKKLSEDRIAKVRANNPQPRVSGKFAASRPAGDEPARQVNSLDDFSRFLDERQRGNR